MKKITVMLLLLTATFYCKAQNEGEITGKVLDEETNEALPGAHMILKSGDTKVMEVATNDNGIYVFKPVKPGIYDVSIIFIGYDTTRYLGLQVNSNGINYQDFIITPGVKLDPFTVRPSLVDDQVPGIIDEFSAEDFNHMAVTNPVEVAAQAATVLVDERTGGLFIGGSREDATMYVVDGVKVIGSLYVPMNSIETISVLTGGIPANYGDFTGGIVEITTKGYDGIF